MSARTATRVYGTSPDGPAGGRGTTPLLEIRDLVVEFHTSVGMVRAVDGISLRLEAGETLALLGESGSGKSVTALAVMGLLESPAGRVAEGEILFRGQDIKRATAEEFRWIRGRHIGMVFQDPLSALNPVFTVGYQIAEVFRRRRGTSWKESRCQAVELMRRVQIPDAARRMGEYPHELSGGMRQRVGIAIALALEPDLLIADEPTTALDVTVQARILRLLEELQERDGMGLILITHDLAVAAEVAEQARVMYAGRIVEGGALRELYTRPGHPYTKGLLGSVPVINRGATEVIPIPGSPPDLRAIPEGCSFYPRCPVSRDRCRSEDPALRQVLAGRHSACHYAEEVVAGVRDS